MLDLESIYRRTLAECAPGALVRPFVSRLANVVAIGKCAGPLLDAFTSERAFAAIPKGYPGPDRSRAGHLQTMFGGHPDIDEDSFAAGDALLRFIDDCDDVLFLISGGGSACVEVPLAPFTRDDVATVNRKLVDAGLPIAQINTVRKQLSAIKGGRLGARVHGRSKTLVYSDVSSGALADVASGPTIAGHTSNEDAARILQSIGGCERIVKMLRENAPETLSQIDDEMVALIADNTTMTERAAHFVREAGYSPIVWPHQIETSVDEAARIFAERTSTLGENEVIVAGGEPTVTRRGAGKGGRCCELAVRFAMLSPNAALFGTSDGVDGSSGVAAVTLPCSRGPRTGDRRLLNLLETSDSLSGARRIGHTVIIPPTGNNLRDLFLVAGVKGHMAHH